MDEEAVRQLAKEIGILPTEVVRFQFPIGAYMRWDDKNDLRGVVATRKIGLAPPAPPPANVCELTRLLDLMGFSRTGNDGSVIVHVREFVCWDEWKIGSEDQVWVVATARSTEPAFLTHVVQVPQVGPQPTPITLDLQLRVFSWDAAGQPKPNVPFTWRAVFPVSLPGGEE
jgi:hypothetical protein